MAGTGTMIAAGIAGTGTHPFALIVGGIDLVRDPGGSGLGSQVDTIRISERGPGGVSSMTFRLDDPAKTFTPTDLADVAYWDVANNACLFRGFLDEWEAAPAFGGQGRIWTLGCVGVEAMLDWAVCTPLTVTNPTLPYFASLLASTFAPRLRAPMIDGWLGSPGAPFTRSGSFTYPVGFMSDGTGGMDIAPFVGPQTSILGTLRRTVEDYANRCIRTHGLDWHPETVSVLLTVDFYFGLRLWEDDTAFQPDDYTTLSVIDTTAGPNRAADLRFSRDPGDAYRSVYVAGGNAAGSGYFGDGTGVFGRTALINDSTITDADSARARAVSFMGAQTVPYRGSFDLEDWTPPTTVHAGSLVTITDDATGATGTYRIGEIAKTFNTSGRQNWTVHFGGLRRSAMRQARRLTRDTVN